jgi:hypothetical protein
MEMSLHNNRKNGSRSFRRKTFVRQTFVLNNHCFLHHNVPVIFPTQYLLLWRHDTQDNDIKGNDTQHNDIQHDNK